MNQQSTNPNDPTNANAEASSNEPAEAGRNNQQSQPVPGDLIAVEKSEWYALPDGGVLRVCEFPGWTTPGFDIYVAPRHAIRTFWGPNHGAPDGRKRIYMSSSGGPFKTITLSRIAALERTGRQLDWFWRWQDYPRAAGGIDYQQEVTTWKLSLLPDTGTYACEAEEVSR